MKSQNMFTHIFAATFLIAVVAAPTAKAQLTANDGKTYAAGLNGPRGLVFGPDGDLYIAEAGTGGSLSTASICPDQQVASPPGPYLGGSTAVIAKVDSRGNITVVAKDLASSQNAGGDTFGVADVAFLNGTLYGLIAGGGCSHGNANAKMQNGIVKVNIKAGTWNYITDLSAFYKEHPAAYIDKPDFEADGVPYSLLAYEDKLLTVEANHGQITKTTTDGTTTLLADLSFSQGHIVPTSIATNNNNLYVGNLGLFPILTERERVLTLTKDLLFVDFTPGLDTTLKELLSYRVASSRAGFTTIISLKFGPDGLLYALELSPVAGFPTPGAGEVVRLNRDGTITPVVTGLTLPTGMTFGPDHALYVSNNGDGPAGSGTVLRFAVQ